MISILSAYRPDALSGEGSVLFREEFNSLKEWEPLYFPKIKRHTSYTIKSEGDKRYLKAVSNASASAMVYKHRFNPYEFPNIRWRWKIENTYKKGDAKTKAGDDYPIRIYVMFQYNPEDSTLVEKAEYEAMRLIYGRYPPKATLNYIWSNKPHKERMLTNTYTERARMIPLEHGDKKAGRWVVEDVNILKDYREAFGEDPPEVASIAIMNDSDNTGESSTSYIDYIEVYR